MAGLPSREAPRLCVLCEDEVPEKHYWVGHPLTPFTLAVCPECFTWRESWDIIADQYFDTQVDHWQAVWGKDFPNGPPLPSFD